MTLFVSALLLFSIQPMFAKMVLPKLGGAPAVWMGDYSNILGVMLRRKFGG